MAEENETIADIIAEKRRLAKEIRDDANGIFWNKEESKAVDLEDDADRLEAARKRERGDVAKLRDAIDYLCERMADMDATFDPSEVECLRAALAAPARNCDRFNSGNAERDAEMAWDAITSRMDLQFSDLTDREIAIIKEAMRGFVWLFTTADESEAQEGGAK